MSIHSVNTNTTTAWCSVLEWLCQWSVKNFYWVNNWINYIANAGILNFNMVPYVPGFNFIDIKRNRDISTLWFKPCFYWFGATQVETKLSLLISYKDSEPLHTVNLCFPLSGYSKIVRLGCSTLGHFLSVNFSRRINWATEWVKEKKKERKKPPTGSAFSVTAEPVNVVLCVSPKKLIPAAGPTL